MIETPIVGRFLGEGRRLVFGPPALYHRFVQAVGVLGAAFVLVAVLRLDVGLWPGWWFAVGAATLLASVLAALSLRLMAFDLRERTYRLRQGPGLFPATRAGRLDELDALVLIAEPNLLRSGVTYHLVLHWKGQRQPPLVVQQDARSLPSGAPLNALAAPLRDLGARYAAALGVPFYDNAHFASPNPVPLLR